jgi:selenide,water dikinase
LEGFSDKLGMDCSIVPSKKHKGLYTVSTTDFFFPLIEYPYVMGKITCANVLSDLYALGVVDCDNMLMLLAASRKLSDKENDIVLKLIMKGFNDSAKEAETEVTGGQTVNNEWLLMGGVAISMCSEKEFIMPVNAVPGDVIVLTKPLGTQVAVLMYSWLSKEEKWNKVKDIISKQDALDAYQAAMDSMSRLNRTAAKLMHKYGAHAATDVTGFGILGHASNLASNQKENVDFEIHTLPIFKNMAKVDKKFNFKLLKGTSAETSGGMLICLPPDKATQFCKEIEEIDGVPACIIGRVVKGTKTARIVDDVKILDM